jgi:hypothetical protein
VLTASKLRTLDEERFYSLIDVALDIRGELDFGADPVTIPLRRTVIRYPVLYPAHTPSVLDRYCDLRVKAMQFLIREGHVSDYTYIDAFGLSNWEDSLELVVADKPGFYRLVVMLTEEEERRQPGTRAKDLPSAMAHLEQLGERFHRVALRLATRYAQRHGLVVADEYDVQDLFGALLETRFSDIRPEEWTSSHAGKPARVDFLLKEELVVVETKMTRDGLNDGKLGDELIIDSDRYKKHPDCKALFCFVYDPEHRLKNPDGLEADLSRKTDHLHVRVQVRPGR